MEKVTIEVELQEELYSTFRMECFNSAVDTELAMAEAISLWVSMVTRKSEHKHMVGTIAGWPILNRPE